MIEIFLLIVFIILILLVTNIRIVTQASAYVLERVGKFEKVWGVGIHFKIPFIDRVAKKVNLKEQAPVLFALEYLGNSHMMLLGAQFENNFFF